MHASPLTTRLVFSRPVLDDFAESAAMWAAPETTRHIGGLSSTEEESFHRLLRNAGHWAMLGYGYWVMRERETGRFVGETGFKQCRRGFDPVLDIMPEAGWVLAPWAWRQGFGTEAVTGILDWADRLGGWDVTVCLIDPANAASLRIAARHGYFEQARYLYKGASTLLLRRERGAGA